MKNELPEDGKCDSLLAVLSRVPATKITPPCADDPPVVQFADAIRVLRDSDIVEQIERGSASKAQQQIFQKAFDVVFDEKYSERLDAYFRVDANMQARLSRFFRNAPMELGYQLTDMFPIDGAVSVRRHAWNWLALCTGDKTVQTSLKSAGKPVPTTPTTENAERATFKACLWRAPAARVRLTPQINASELLIVITSGTATIELNDSRGEVVKSYAVAATDQRVSRLRLRSAEGCSTPWLPGVSICPNDGEAAGLIVVGSQFGVPYDENSSGTVTFIEAAESSAVTASERLFWKLLSDNKDCTPLSHFDRRGKPDDAKFFRVADDADNVGFPHQRPVMEKNFDLFQEIYPDAESDMQLLVRFVEVPERRPEKTFITSHPGAELIIPLEGCIQAVVGHVKALGSDNRTLVVGGSGSDENWRNAGCISLDAYANRGGVYDPDVIVISSAKALHGFRSTKGTARALFIGTNVYESEAAWFEKFYAGQHLHGSSQQISVGAS